MAIWNTLRTFGIFHVHLVQFWYRVPRKIWQPRILPTCEGVRGFVMPRVERSLDVRSVRNERTIIRVLIAANDVNHSGRTFLAGKAIKKNNNLKKQQLKKACILF
jgi:hypothetical protein